MFGDQHRFPCDIDFSAFCRAPVIVRDLRVVTVFTHHFVLATDADGHRGVFKLNWVGDHFRDFFVRMVLPCFAGKDARELPRLIHEAYRGLYKFHGLPLWSCIATVECALLDLLGQVARRPVSDFLGGALRRKLPFYLSYMTRDTEPEADVDAMAARVAETGARAIKFKIGGRLGLEEGPIPRRTERLVALARARLGSNLALYADANGSYDSRRAIEVGRMLQDHGYALYEEPCPFEEYDETRAVAEALAIPVSGGEQDCNLWQLRRMVESGVVDVVQPDVIYVGGLLRAHALAKWAAAAGKPIVPHSPRGDSELAAVLHFCAAQPNLHTFVELPARLDSHPWFTPAHRFSPDGCVALPEGPGFGVAYAPEIIAAT